MAEREPRQLTGVPLVLGVLLAFLVAIATQVGFGRCLVGPPGNSVSVTVHAYDHIAPDPLLRMATRASRSHGERGHLAKVCTVNRSGRCSQSTPRATLDSFTTVVAAENGVNIEGANFAQTTASNSFSAGGTFAGQTIGDVAGQLDSGALSPADVPIQVIARDGSTLILSTRSALALEKAGIPRSAWIVENVTGDPVAEARLSGQLAGNGLDSSGTATVRITGGG
jgi:hypothetical protein